MKKIIFLLVILSLSSCFHNDKDKSDSTEYLGPVNIPEDTGPDI